MLTKLILLFVYTTPFALTQIISGINQLTCSQSDISPVVKRICNLLGFSSDSVPNVFINTGGCEKKFNSTHCQICQSQYILIADSGECVLARTIELVQDPIDIDEPFIDLTDQFEQLYGSSSRKVNQFNIKNHPDLSLSSISEGISISGRIGIYNTLYYKNPSFQTTIITITNCDGSINQIFYSVNENHFIGPLSLIRYLFRQNSALGLYALRYIENNQFMIFLSNADTYSKVQYNFGATDFGSFNLQASSLIQILEPIGQQKLISQNYQFNYVQFPIKQNRNSIIFEDNSIVLGIQVIGCKILVNQILPKNIIGDSQRFFENYQQASSNSLISNIHPIKNISLIQGSNFIFNITLNLPDVQFQQQPKLDIILSEQNGESIFGDIAINGQSVTRQVKQISQEINLQLPNEQTDSDIIFRLSDIFCIQQNLQLGCIECIIGYKPNFAGVCISEKCIQFSVNQCLLCENGFHLFNGDCKVNQQFCVDYHLITGKCKQCLQGYSLNDKFQCDKDANQIRLCQILDNQEGCQRCINGYELKSRTSCEPIIQIQGCLSINPQRNRCQICQSNYTINIFSGQCNRIQRFCASYNESTSLCVECIPSYRLVRGICQPLEGCRAQFIQTTSGECVDEKCIQVKDGVCETCIDRYYISNNFCLKVSDLCEEYDMTSGDCTSCKEGFSLSSGACVNQTIFCSLLQGNTCVKCPFRAYLSGEKCYPVNDQCSKWNNENGDCQECYSGFYLIAGVCLIGQDPRTDQNCIFRQSLYCERCRQGFFPVQGYCTSQLPNCGLYSSTTGQCLRCSSDFILSSDKSCIFSPA